MSTRARAASKPLPSQPVGEEPVGEEPSGTFGPQMCLSERLSGVDGEDAMPLEPSIFCHIFILNSVLERTGNRVAEAHNLTLPQWMALGCIGRAPGEGVTHSELGQKLMLSKAPITGVVDRLERAGFVTRTTSASDRRVSRIQSTESGAQVWREVRDGLRAQAMEHCECLGDEGKAQLLSLLTRLLEQVASSDPMLDAMRGSGVRRQVQVFRAQQVAQESDKPHS